MAKEKGLDKPKTRLMDRMLKAGSIAEAAIMSDSEFFNNRDLTPLQLPVLNIICSGDIKGGLPSGLTVFAGQSKSFKTLLGLYCMKAYMDKYEDSIVLFYDSEFGATPDYVSGFGIDTSRIIHIPVKHIEAFIVDMTKRLTEIDRGEKVFIFIDSIGQMASLREIENALKDNVTVDVGNRQKVLKSAFRIAMGEIATKDLTCVSISHTYKTMEIYSKEVASIGTGGEYAANQIFIITKSQEKEGDAVVGTNFKITANKSRFVHEKSQVSFTVYKKAGISKYSGLLDLALEAGVVAKPSNGWYQLVDCETGELIGDKIRAKETKSAEFNGKILSNPKFNNYINDKYKLKTLTADDANKVEEDDEEEA